LIRRNPLLVALLLAGVTAVPAARADTPFRAVRDGATVVFTNIGPNGQSRPAGERRPAARGRAARLPVTEFDPFIESVAEEFGLSVELIKSVALVESGFDPGALSPKGAQGLMQLMPGTAAQYGVRDAFDPRENLRAGARHLRSLLDEFDGDLTLALAAYNAGSGAVRRHGGVPAYPETRAYVRKVRASMGRESRARIPPPPPVRMERRADGSVVLSN